MKKWNEAKAMQVVRENGGEVRGKMIVVKGGFKGLSGCSAFDYLVNHCGYHGNLS